MFMLSVNLKNSCSIIKGSAYSVRHLYQKASSSAQVGRLGKKDSLCFIFYEIENSVPTPKTETETKRKQGQRNKLN